MFSARKGGSDTGKGDFGLQDLKTLYYPGFSLLGALSARPLESAVPLKELHACDVAPASLQLRVSPPQHR